MPGHLPEQIGQILMLVSSDFQRRLDADLRVHGTTGINQRHRGVFLHLDKYGASRSVDLAKAAGIRPQSMMTIIHELEELGMIERQADPSDSRAKLINFTKKGHNLIRELSRSTQAVWQSYTAKVGEKKLRQTFVGLQQLILGETV